MKKLLATLGPSGTFSETAATIGRALLSDGTDYQIKYFRSLRLTCDAIPDDCSIGVVPLENSLAGYVPEVLDKLAEGQITIVGQISLQVAFSLVSRTSAMDEIDCVYVQHMASLQCSKLIENLEVPVIYVESNSAALEMLLQDKTGKRAGAIVSTLALDGLSRERGGFTLRVDKILDASESITRFAMIAEKNSSVTFLRSGDSFSSSAIICPLVNSAGVLEQILKPFSKRSINLSSIISRTGAAAGQGLYFFVHFDSDVGLVAALEDLSEVAKVYHFPLYQCFF